MLHLTFEEISEFVAMDTLALNNHDLAVKVLTHIRSCAGCREALGAMLGVTEVLEGARRSLEAQGSKEKEK